MVMTHWRLAWLKPRSLSMWGSAMFTMVPSSTIMSWAAQRTKSARPSRLGGVSWEVNSPAGSCSSSTVVEDMGVPSEDMQEWWCDAPSRSGSARAGRGGEGGGARREDDAVHELGDAVRSGSSSRDQSLVDRQGRQDHEQGVEVGVVADLASLSGVLEDGAGGLDLRGQEPLVDAACQVGLAVDDGEQRPPRADDDLVVEASVGARLGEQVATQGAGVRILLGGAVDEQPDGVDDEVALVRPPPVERRLGRPGRGGDGVEGEPVVAGLTQHLDGRLEDLDLAVTCHPGTARVGRVRRARAGRARVGRAHAQPGSP